MKKNILIFVGLFFVGVNANSQIAFAESVSVVCPGAEDAVYVQVTAKTNETMIDQPITLLYEIFSRVDLRYEGFSTEPSVRDAWMETVPQEIILKKERSKEKIDGKTWLKAPVHEKIIFPLKAGNFQIDPGSISVSYKTNAKWQFPKKLDMEIVCESMNLKVNDFPLENRPTDFSGKGGEFSISSAKPQQENGSYFFDITFSGKGNVSNLFLPTALNLGPDVKFLYWKTLVDQGEVQVKSKEVIGKKTFRIYYVPLKTGEIELKPLNYSYYDFSSAQYETLTAKSKLFTVDAFPENSATQQIYQSDLPYLAILLDSSGSMFAADYKPSRMVFLQDQIEAFIQSKPEAKIFLATFGEKVNVVSDFDSPKTKMIDDLRNQDGSRTVGSSTAISKAVLNALEGFQWVSNQNKKHMILLTDGNLSGDSMDLRTLAEIIKQQNVTLDVLATVSQTKEVPYPVVEKNGELKYVDVELPFDTRLKEIPALTGGKLFRVKNAEDIRIAFDEIIKASA